MKSFLPDWRNLKKKNQKYNSGEMIWKDHQVLLMFKYAIKVIVMFDDKLGHYSQI